MKKLRFEKLELLSPKEQKARLVERRKVFDYQKPVLGIWS